VLLGYKYKGLSTERSLALVKKKKVKPQREVTKRQLSRWQQQKRRQRLIRGLGLFIIVAVLGIVVGGWYITQYRPLHQTVIKVNDAKFNMNYYIKMLQYYGQGQPAQYMSYLADEVVTVIQRNELVRQGAMELGITVSGSEVNKELKQRDPPLSNDYKDVVRTEMLISKLRDEHFEQHVPLYAEQRHIMAMLLESESQADEVIARLEAGESFAELAGELSLESLSKLNGGDLGWRPEGGLAALLGISVPDEYAFDCEIGVLSQPIYDEDITKGIGYWLIRVMEREEEQAYVHIILLGSEKEAQDVRARLEAGEDLAGLAQEFSQDDFSRERDGDLGWVLKEAMSQAFEEYVFNSELEVWSEPIRDNAPTKGGYWLIKVLDKDDNKQIEGENRELLKAKALSEWISALWDNPENNVESYLDDEMKMWAIEQAIES